jgi:hypothetical protein
MRGRTSTSFSWWISCTTSPTSNRSTSSARPPALARKGIVSFEPVREQTNWLGRWIIAHDRGDYIRPLESLHRLFEAADLLITESLPLSLGLIETRAIFCDRRPSAGSRRAA